MLLRSPLWSSALWSAALAACQDRATQCTSAPRSASNNETSSCPSWVETWSLFFQGVELGVARHQHCFELLPASLLQSVGQHWVDCTLDTIVSARLAKVCPPARTTLASTRGSSCSFSPTSTSSSGDVAVDGSTTTAASLEALLSMWSAHTLLAELHKKAALSPAAAVQDVQNTLAQSLRADVLPVVSYITRFSSLQNGDDFFLVRVHVLSRALVFVLSSFLAEWHRSDRGDGNERRPSSSADVPHLSMAEAALARELCEWISVLQQRADETRGSDADVRLFSVAYRKESDSLCSSIASPRQPAEAQGSFAGASTEQQVDRTCGGRTYWSDVRALRENTAEQFQLLQSTLTSRYTGAEDEERAMRSTEYQSTPSCHRSWMDELCEQATAKRESCGRDDCRETQRQPPVASPSPFAGVTGVAAAVEEPTEVLASINAALNQVALSSSKEV